MYSFESNGVLPPIVLEKDKVLSSNQPDDIDTSDSVTRFTWKVTDYE